MDLGDRLDDATKLEAALATSRAEAAKWETAYRRLRAQPPVRAMVAARRAGIQLREHLSAAKAVPVVQLPAPEPVVPEPVVVEPAAPKASLTAPFSVPYRAPAGYREGSLARLDPTISDRRFQAFDTVLGLFPTGRLIDLGAGHGIFSIRAADAGWDVTALDARTERFPTDDRITWVHQDMREHDLGSYDLIVCLGLFYHLTLADQRDLLTRAAGTPILIDTHVDVGITYPDDRLGERVEEDGYSGRLYGEHLESPLASWVNESSFWPDLDSFYRMLADHGYPVALALEPWYQPERTFFLALPGR